MPFLRRDWLGVDWVDWAQLQAIQAAIRAEIHNPGHLVPVLLNLDLQPEPIDDNRMERGPPSPLAGPLRSLHLDPASEAPLLARELRERPANHWARRHLVDGLAGLARVRNEQKADGGAAFVGRPGWLVVWLTGRWHSLLVLDSAVEADRYYAEGPPPEQPDDNPVLRAMGVRDDCRPQSGFLDPHEVTHLAMGLDAMDLEAFPQGDRSRLADFWAAYRRELDASGTDAPETFDEAVRSDIDELCTAFRRASAEGWGIRVELGSF